MEVYKVKCTKVIDGDTFEGNLIIPVSPLSMNLDLYGQRFRLYGVETPERGEPLYFEAAEFTAQHLEDKEGLVFIHGKDDFGRWLVTVYFEGIYESLNEKLKSEGLARVWKKNKR